MKWRLIGYAALLAAVMFAMFSARDRALTRLSTPESITEWEAWRNDVRQQQTNPGPVARRVPKSGEPPALVLMRDHFGVTLFGAVLFSTALYWVTVWFVNGILAGGRRAS